VRQVASGVVAEELDLLLYLGGTGEGGDLTSSLLEMDRGVAVRIAVGNVLFLPSHENHNQKQKHNKKTKTHRSGNLILRDIASI